MERGRGRRKGRLREDKGEKGAELEASRQIFLEKELEAWRQIFLEAVWRGVAHGPSR
jgi:hypothetical protein